MKSSLLGVSLLAAARVLAFDADTIGFYPFEGATPGASAVGPTVVNKVQADQFAGSVTLTSGATNPFAVFDEDAPGKYVYAGNCGEPLCENPRSVSVGSDATSGGKGGSLTIADIGTELSKHHATGNTVEYFFKMASTSERRYSAGSASVLVYGGYLGKTSAAAQAIQLYAPNESGSWSAGVVSVGDKGSTSTNPYRVDISFPNANAGWHHVAIVEKTDHTVDVYYDYKLVNTSSKSMTMFGVTELTESKPFVFFNDKLQGKVSCLRFTTRALDSDEFMRASDTPFVPAGKDAFAFYPFEDATPGESAVGQTVVNKVRGDLFSGSVSLTSGATNPFAKFDEDAPGKYIYAGNSGDPLCENPRSINVGSDATSGGAGGSLTISDIGTEISRHHATGNTVEYFFKLASQSERRYSAGGSSVYVYGGYLGMSGVAQPLRIYAPNTASSWSEGVISVGAKDGNDYRQAIAFGAVNSGWHHVAIVEKSDQTVEVYYDYKLAMSAALTMYGTEKRTDSLPFIFFNNNLQGKVSCLRFSSRALGKDEFLKASNTLPAYAGDDAFAFYPFEGVTSGASAVGDTVVNKVRGDLFPGKVALSGSTSSNPFAKFDSDSPGAIICDGVCGTIVSENPQSVRVGSDATSTGTGGTMTIADIGTELSKHHATGNTVEYFFKMASTTEKRYTQGAASVLVHGGYLGTSAAAQPLQLYAPNGSSWSENVISVGDKGSGGSNQYRKDFKFNGVNDDGWHHVAIVEKTDHTVEIYYDYKQVMNNGEPLTMAGVTELTESKPFVFFNDARQGKVSCLRFTSRALETTQFLRAYSRKVDGIVQPDVVAFYTFKDGAKGSSAVGVTLLNDVDMTAHGSATASGASSTVVFDDDCPGAAIYGGEEYPQEPFALNPQSVVLTSTSAGSSGTLSFPGLSQVFYGAHGTGFTFECFFKLVDDNMTQWETSWQLNAGYLANSAVKPFFLNLPHAKTGNTCHYGLAEDKSATLPKTLYDGAWHHLACVETPIVDASQSPATTNWEVTVWVDYTGVGKPTVVSDIVGSADLLGSQGLDICRNKLHAKFSCVKVTTRPLGRKEFMRTRPRSMGTSIIIR